MMFFAPPGEVMLSSVGTAQIQMLYTYKSNGVISGT